MSPNERKIKRAVDLGMRTIPHIAECARLSEKDARTYLAKLARAGHINIETRCCEACGRKHKAYV